MYWYVYDNFVLRQKKNDNYKDHLVDVIKYDVKSYINS